MNTRIYQMQKKKKKREKKYKPKKLFLKAFNYNDRFENEESTDKEESVDLPDMPPLEGAEEGKGLKTLAPNKLLTRLPILLAQIKAGNNSCKLRSEIRQILYCIFCISIIKSLKKFKTI